MSPMNRRAQQGCTHRGPSPPWPSTRPAGTSPELEHRHRLHWLDHPLHICLGDARPHRHGVAHQARCPREGVSRLGARYLHHRPAVADGGRDLRGARQQQQGAG